jgi:hypothetical protein
MKYSGIDLHSNNSVVVVSDEVDRVLVRRRVANDAAAILALLARTSSTTSCQVTQMKPRFHDLRIVPHRTIRAWLRGLRGQVH